MASTLSLFNTKAGVFLDSKVYLLGGVGNPGYTTDTIEAPIGSTYSRTDTPELYLKFDVGEGLDKWKKIQSIPSNSNINAVSGSGTVADQVYVDEVQSMKWSIDIYKTLNPRDKYSCEVVAVHNGTTAIDATNVEMINYSIMEMGNKIDGLIISVNLSGMGTEQMMQLFVGCSTELVNVFVKRIVTGSNISNNSPLDMSSIPHDISTSIEGNLSNNQIVMLYPPTRTIKILSNFPNSRATCLTAPTLLTVFEVYKLDSALSSTLIGTITFNANSNIGVFSSSLETYLTPSDILKINAQNNVDLVISDVSITLQVVYM